MSYLSIAAAVVGLTACTSDVDPNTGEVTWFDFESRSQAWHWQVPQWARKHAKFVGDEIEVVERNGTGSRALAIPVEYPEAPRWYGTQLEGKWAIDLSDYDSLSLGFALPADAPPEVGVAVSLKVGDELDEIQMADPEILAVGELTSIELDLSPGATGWVRDDQPVVVDASTFANVRGIGIAWGVYAFDYTGKTTLYVDTIRLCCAEVDS